MKPADTLVALAGQFALLSLLAFGGANAVAPEVHRQAVEVRHWINDRQFADLFAIAQAAPGPNFMLSTLVGLKAGGVAGAVVATVAICAPSCLLTFWVARLWDRYRAARWRTVIGAGLAPVTIGLVGASGWLLVRAADRDARLAVVTLVTAGLAYFTRLNPLWGFLAAGLLGVGGLLV